MITIEHIDHFVLTVASVKRACSFYNEKLGMEVVAIGNNRKALKFGVYKINLHQLGNELEPKARNAQPGSADICFITRLPIEKVREELINKNVLVITNIITRTANNTQIKSIYFNDPDGNLLKISNYTNDN